MAGLEPRKILLLTRYDRLGASSRVRFLQFLRALAAQGFDFDVRPFFGDEYVRAIYSGNLLILTLGPINDAHLLFQRRAPPDRVRENDQPIYRNSDSSPYFSIISTAH